MISPRRRFQTYTEGLLYFTLKTKLTCLSTVRPRTARRHHSGTAVVPVYGHHWRLPRMSHSRVLPTSRGGCCYDHHDKVRNPVVSVFHPRTPDNFTTVVSLPFQGVTESHVLFRYSGALTLSSVFHPRTPTTSPPWCRRCSRVAESHATFVP